MSELNRIREARRHVQQAAIARFNSRAAERGHVREVLERSGPGAADSPARQERYRARLDGIALARQLKTAARLPLGVERRMGPTLDFTDFPPSEVARNAGRPVARIVTVPSAGFQAEGFGTGFMVAPTLLMTNWHVFPSANDAVGCGANFFYERTERGVQQGTIFRFDPGTFFVSDESLDFAILALDMQSMDGRPLGSIGQLTLIEATPKILKGYPVNIIQHPEGGAKQYAIEQNRLIDILESGFLHYETDTLEGSSGAPAFSQNWELVALHHASIPLMKDGRVLRVDGSEWTEGMPDHDVQWIANEGVRISAIIGCLNGMTMESPAKQKILNDLLATTTDPIDDVVRAAARAAQPESLVVQSDAQLQGRSGMAGVQMNFSGPVTIHVYAGAPVPAAVQSAAQDVPQLSSKKDTEASIRFDPDYDERAGYAANFLDEHDPLLAVPVPGISEERLGQILKDETGNPLILKYHHFELVMNRARRLQMWSAVNVDYNPELKSERDRDEFGRDRWIPDPRIPAQVQIFDADFYKPAGNIDRGHIVRREDNAWGESESDIEFANSDTFHWTNCTPQHEAFNQAVPGRNDRIYRGMEGVWGAFENHIQQSRTGNDTRACILAGPVLADDEDPSADFGRGPIQYPLRFWKVVCIADQIDQQRELKVFGFLLNQSAVVDRFGIERFRPGRFARYQVSLKEIKEATGVTFDDKLHRADVMAGKDSRQLTSPAEIAGL